MLARETDPPLLHSLNSSFSLFIVSCVPRIKHIHALFPLEAENNFAKVSFFPSLERATPQDQLLTFLFFPATKDDGMHSPGE